MHPEIPHSNNSHSNLPHSLYHYNLRKLSYSYFPRYYLIRRTSTTQKDYCYHQKSKYVAYLLTCHQTNHYFIIGLILAITIFSTNRQIHELRTPREKIAFIAEPKIHSHSQILRYGQRIYFVCHMARFFRYLCLIPSLGVRCP